MAVEQKSEADEASLKDGRRCTVYILHTVQHILYTIPTPPPPLVPPGVHGFRLSAVGWKMPYLIKLTDQRPLFLALIPALFDFKRLVFSVVHGSTRSLCRSLCFSAAPSLPASSGDSRATVNVPSRAGVPLHQGRGYR